MKIKSILLSIVCLFLFSCKESPEKTIHKVIENYRNHNNITYDISYEVRPMMSDSTFKYKASVALERLPEDSVFGGKLFLNFKDVNLKKIYDLEKIFIIIEKEKMITQFNDPRNEKFAIKGNFPGNVIETYFLHPDKLLENLEDREIKSEDLGSQIKITLINQDISIEELRIDKSNWSINEISLKVFEDDWVQEEIWKLSNIIFNSLKPDFFKNQIEDLPEDYLTEEYIEPEKDFYALLPIKNEAPPIFGNFFPNYSEQSKTDFDKITVLDFWYTTCYPCIKSIPELNELHEKYGSKIQIIGVNDKNNKAKDSLGIKKFLSHYPINYDILLTDKVPREYNIKAYPTIYIIDKNGKVAFSQIGFSENFYEKLDTNIKQLMEL